MGFAMAESCYVSIVRSKYVRPGCCGSVSVRGHTNRDCTGVMSGSTLSLSDRQPGTLIVGEVLSPAGYARPQQRLSGNWRPPPMASRFNLSIYPSIHPPVYLSMYPSISSSIFLSICLSVHLFAYPSIHLFIYLST